MNCCIELPRLKKLFLPIPSQNRRLSEPRDWLMGQWPIRMVKWGEPSRRSLRPITTWGSIRRWPWRRRTLLYKFIHLLKILDGNQRILPAFLKQFHTSNFMIYPLKRALIVCSHPSWIFMNHESWSLYLSSILCTIFRRSCYLNKNNCFYNYGFSNFIQS